jgi:hypothetical protein
MKVKNDLVGKTITAIVAGSPRASTPREIWMLQFSDGTCVEFVSPAARQHLRRISRRPVSDLKTAPIEASQLLLNVA